MQKFEYQGKKFTINDDGSTEVIDELGRTTRMFGGKTTLSVRGGIKSMSFKSPLNIKSYRVEDEGSIIIHKIEMHSGGWINISYTGKDEVVEIQAAGDCPYQLTSDNDVVVGEFNFSEPK